MAMEFLSLEEKIATFKKKIDDLDQSAPSGPAPDTLYEAPELENGKIVAMKQSLVSKGLSADADAATGAAGAAHKGDGSASSKEGGVGGLEAEKAAKLAAEFETGKIAAMKSRLVSKGLGLDAARAAKVMPAGAARAAAAAAPAAAPAAKDTQDAEDAGMAAGGELSLIHI